MDITKTTPAHLKSAIHRARCSGIMDKTEAEILEEALNRYLIRETEPKVEIVFTDELGYKTTYPATPVRTTHKQGYTVETYVAERVVYDDSELKEFQKTIGGEENG